MLTLGKQSFWRNVTPGAAVRDFAVLWKENPYRWRVLAISIVMTGLLLYGFVPRNVRVPPEKAQITYITTFAPDRTDEEIIASNIENQKIKERNEAIEAQRLEERKEFFRKLGRATGLDVDELERQYSDKPAAAPAPAAPADPEAAASPTAQTGTRESNP